MLDLIVSKFLSPILEVLYGHAVLEFDRHVQSSCFKTF